MAGRNNGGVTSGTRKPGGGGGGGTVSDSGPPSCHIDFRIGLTGARPGVLAGFSTSGDLDVGLENDGGYQAVVCRIPGTGTIVGSLSNYRGLNDLIGCLQRGFRYTAQIVSLRQTMVEVHVRSAAS